MAKPMIGTKIAVLVASGFDEPDLTATQRALIDSGASVRIISSDHGLVNGWDGDNWGHNYAIDAQLNTALGVDYDGLIIPGGRRSADKLKLTAHAKRFIGSFMASMKPVACMNDGLLLMAYTGLISGRTVAGPEEVCRVPAEGAGAAWSENAICMDGALLTGVTGTQGRGAYVEAMIAHFVENAVYDQAA